MAISYELACCNSLRFPGVQHRVSEYVLTLRQLPQASDQTKGQLYRDAAASNGTPVYVVSDIYYPTDDSGAINLLWKSRYYRMEFDLPTKVGQRNAYIATRLVGMSPREAVARRSEERSAVRRLKGRANALIATSAQTQAPGAATAEETPYNNEDEGLYNNEDEGLYNNN